MALPVIAVIGLAVSATGTVMNYSAQKKQGEAQQAAARAQEQAMANNQAIEAKRERQMELDAQRRRSQIARSALAGHSMATAVATSQGAASEGSSGIGGAFGGVSGQSGTNLLGVNQNEELGGSIFDLNQSTYGSYRTAAAAGAYNTGGGALGAGLSSLGGTVLRSDTQIAKVGSAFSSWFGSGSSGGDNAVG